MKETKTNLGWSPQEGAKGGSKFSRNWMKSIVGAAFVSMAIAQASASTGLTTSAPKASWNKLDSAAHSSKPFANVWGGTETWTPSGASLSFSSTASSTGYEVINTTKLDFSSAGAVAVDVRNPTNTEADVMLYLEDSSGKAIKTRFAIPANTTQSIAMLMVPQSLADQYGFANLPNPYSGIQVAKPYWTGGTANLKAIQRLAIFPNGDVPATSIILSNVRLLQSVDWSSLLTSSIDAFGQATFLNWSNKLANASQLDTRRAAEEAAYTNILGNTADSYGGSLTLPHQAATGHFRTQKVGGKWWLVDPLGNLFFMNGVDQVSPKVGATQVTGRAGLFQSLPASNDPLSANYINSSDLVAGGTGQSYNFYTSNMQRKYKTADWQSNFVNSVTQRFHTWGLNTLGSFVQTAVFANANLPYIKEDLIRGDFNTVSTGSDLWGSMADPFDAQWSTAVTKLATLNAKSGNNDPNLIGYVVENEVSWTGNTGNASDPYALALGTLSQTASKSPAKTEFLSELAAKYGSVQNLNKAWKTSFGTWAAMNSPLTFGQTVTAAMQTDLTNWVGTYATKYYSTIKAAIKKASPNALYFGNSYSVANVSPQIVSIAAANVDVLAFNLYGSSPVSPKFLSLTKGLDLPCVSTEFNFSSAAEGLFTSGSTINQSARASAYSGYVQAALTNPNFVGCNFYMFLDEPVSGVTGYRENFIQGLVDTTDTPYPAMVTTIQTIAKSMYSTRWNS